MISILKRIQPQRQHLTALVVLLLLTFGMTLWLAWAAWDAARQAREQAEDTMFGWSALAAIGYKTNIETALINGLSYAFMNTFAPPREVPDPRSEDLPIEALPRLINPDPLCPCLEDPGSIGFMFRLDLSTGAIQFLGDTPDPAFASWLAQHVRTTPVAILARDSSGVAVAIGRTAGREWFIPYAVLTDEGQRPRYVVGFSADPADLDSLLMITWKLGRLLPQAQPDNGAMLYARIYDPSGALTFETPSVPDTTYAQTRLLSEPLAHARVSVAVHPDGAAALIVGGVPDPPIGRLLGLLAVTAILVVSALLLIRREADLARLRADFIAGVSHELRTPLAQIRMFTETLMLGRVRSEAERSRSLEIIDQEARRLVHLVENVLIFAKSERRKSRINPQLTDLRADLIEAIQGFAVLSRSREIEIRPELQEAVVAPVDRGALRQIVLNLLDNAVKYGPLEQRITVGLALFDDNARIWVDDEGPGIPADQRDKVFGRFIRLSRDVESPVGGSGIGLAIVRELILLHGGRVWIEDAPGSRGARVVAEIPGAYVRPDAATGGWAVA